MSYFLDASYHIIPYHTISYLLVRSYCAIYKFVRQGKRQLGIWPLVLGRHLESPIDKFRQQRQYAYHDQYSDTSSTESRISPITLKYFCMSSFSPVLTYTVLSPQGFLFHIFPALNCMGTFLCIGKSPCTSISNTWVGHKHLQSTGIILDTYTIRNGHNQ